MYQEKRAYERFACDLPIWVRPMGDSGDFIMVESVDISVGGMLLGLESPLEPGSWLELYFDLMDQKASIEARAKVQHVRKQEEAQYLIGISFVEVKNYSVTVLMSYLEAMSRT